MDENTNFSPNPPTSGGEQFSGQPQPPQQQSYQQPASFSGSGSDDDGGSKKWIGWLSLVVLIVVMLYFFGFWNWVGSLIPKSAPSVNEEQPAEELAEEDNLGQDNKDSGSAGDAVVTGKGRVSLLISAGLDLGTTLLKGDSQPNVEIRKIYMHNTVRDSWLLVYDGFRSLDLNLLGSTGEKHELISTMLAAVEYDRIKIEFADLVSIDQKGEQTVSRTRIVELVGPVIVKEGGNQQVNIWFDISDASEPKPRAVLQ